MSVYWLALSSVIFVSLLSLIGVFTLGFKKLTLQRITFGMVSFAVGGLFGDTFIHLLPEAYKQLGLGIKVSLYLCIGLLMFFVLEKIMRWRHCHIPPSAQHIHPVAVLNIFGDALHNFIDGLIIGASYLVSIPLGIATTLAVVLHEIPHEIGNFGILIYSKFTIGQALFFNFLSALTAILGTIFSLLIGAHVSGYTAFLIPFTAGGFIYIAGSDLIPELHHECRTSTSLWQLFWIICGVSIMLVLRFLD